MRATEATPTTEARRRPRTVRGVVAAALVLGLATAVAVGCSSPTQEQNDAAGKPTDLGEATDLRGSSTVTVAMVDNAYQPRLLEVDPGATVTFRNDGANTHDVTPNADGAFAGGTAVPRESVTVTVPTTPGTYRYYCSLHASPDSGVQRGAFIVG